jgi:Tol biopolymer transport system component
MSPEQLRGSTVDTRADVFSLGVVLYEMLTGVHPFSTGTQAETVNAILSEYPSTLSRYVQNAPDLLQHTLEKMLAKQPGERYQSVHEIRTNLTKVMEEITSPTPLAEPEEKRRWLALTLAVFAFVVIIGFAWLYLQLERREPTLIPLESRPLTTSPGVERAASFSPEGTDVAFAWNGEKQENWDVYVKQIGIGKAVRRTTDPAEDHSPSWSPDDSQIAFLRNQERVLLLPKLGGQARPLAEVFTPDQYHNPLTWSPDGEQLVVCDRNSPDEPFRLVLLSTLTAEKKQLTTPPEDYFGDCYPAFSPDGSRLAFIRVRRRVHRGDLYAVPLTSEFMPSEEPTKLTSDDEQMWGVTWSADGTELIFSAGRWEDTKLYRIKAEGASEARLLPLIGENAMDPAISDQGGRLVYSAFSLGDLDIWRIQLEDEGTTLSKFSSSTRADLNAKYSPDGSKVLFWSHREGGPALWVCNSDGSETSRVTEGSSGSWSPHGSKIVFEKGDNIYKLRAIGGPLQQLTDNPAEDRFPSWSANGEWIYFQSNRSGDQQVWKVSAQGGEPILVVEDGGHPQESPDSNFLYYLKAGGLWRIPRQGGAEEQVVESCSPAYEVSDDGIYFGQVSWEDSRSAICYLSLTSEETRQIVTIDKRLARGLSVSPGGLSILCTAYEEDEGDLMLVENFQ